MLAENENRLRMQQNLFEAVRAERNGLQKSLQEANAETIELKTKLKVSSHQSEQLKEDISMKEQQLIKEENILRKITKEKENLRYLHVYKSWNNIFYLIRLYLFRVELNNSQDHMKMLKGEIAEMQAEEKRLHKVIGVTLLIFS